MLQDVVQVVWEKGLCARDVRCVHIYCAPSIWQSWVRHWFPLTLSVFISICPPQDRPVQDAVDHRGVDDCVRRRRRLRADLLVVRRSSDDARRREHRHLPRGIHTRWVDGSRVYLMPWWHLQASLQPCWPKVKPTWFPFGFDRYASARMVASQLTWQNILLLKRPLTH